MQSKKKKTKRVKLKSVVSTPLPPPLPQPQASSSSWPQTIRNAGLQAVSSLKRTLDGSLKLVSHRIVPSDATVEEHIAEKKKQTVEEVISTLLQQSEANGWDQGYTESFLENNATLEDAELETETGHRTRERGKGVSRCDYLLCRHVSQAAQDKALHRWTRDIDNFLRSLITLEGRSNQAPPCRRCCQAGAGDYRCVECDNQGLLCGSCMAVEHHSLPLHRMEVRLHFNFENRSTNAPIIEMER